MNIRKVVASLLSIMQTVALVLMIGVTSLVIGGSGGDIHGQCGK